MSSDRASPAPKSGEAADARPRITRRLRLVQAAIALLLLGLAAALGYAQFVRAAEFRSIEQRQSLRLLMTPAPRGAIYDRDGRMLAGNRSRPAAVLHLGRVRTEFLQLEQQLLSHGTTASDSPPHARSHAATAQARLLVVQHHLERVNALLGRQAALDARRLERHLNRERTSPFVLVDDLSAEEVTRLAAALDAADPIQVEVRSERTYPQSHVAAHVLGRVRRDVIHTPTGENFPILNYLDLIGDSGIEKQYDAQLQGRPGEAVVRVDAFGLVLAPALEQRAPIAGNDLVLSLDLDLQLAAEHAMAATPGTTRGAAVALAVATGEVLALVSKPDFDLNAVSPAMTSATKDLIDVEGGWLNRATQALYPPGSSFKIYTMLAGLRRGSRAPEDTMYCNGHYDVAGHRFRCHNESGHGELSLRRALAQSCNVFAYQTGLAAGPEALAAEARRFHFDRPTGIDLPSETRRMLLPDPAWKNSTGRDAWTPGDTANFAIGQGFLRFTPLQAACAIASLARRETLTVPTLLRQPQRRPTGDLPPEPLAVGDEHYAALIDGLRAVVATGIGRAAQVPGVSIAGKTGTAQIVRPDGMMNVAWFVAFAPVERPEIAIAVALEGDQPNVEFAGAEHAAPVVRELIATYFEKQSP